VKRVLLLVVLAGCARAMPPPATTLDADRSHVELAELQRGRDLLVRKCGSSCHQVPLPTQHAAAEWPAKLDEMSERAGLDRTQRRLIEQYLVTMATR
jgi:hypothetical protein